MASQTKAATEIQGASLIGSGIISGDATGLTTRDNVYYKADCTGNATFSFRAGGFGFTIPSGATIDGYELTLERKRGNTGTGSCVDSTVRLHTGSLVGDNKGTSTGYPTTDTDRVYGGPTDKWNATISVSTINSTSFRVQLTTGITVSSGTVSAEFDYVQMTVYYTESASVKRRSVGGGVSNFSGVAHF